MRYLRPQQPTRTTTASHIAFFLQTSTQNALRGLRARLEYRV